MLVEKKIDCCNRLYLEFNGCSHLYFINGYIENNVITIYTGNKVYEKYLKKLINVIMLCLKNFKVVNVEMRKIMHTFKQGDYYAKS